MGSRTNSREDRAIAQMACPTCKARPGEPCRDREGKRLRSMHGPGIHNVRRKMLSLRNREIEAAWAK